MVFEYIAAFDLRRPAEKTGKLKSMFYSFKNDILSL
jgi:hypothetical protein